MSKMDSIKNQIKELEEQAKQLKEKCNETFKKIESGEIAFQDIVLEKYKYDIARIEVWGYAEKLGFQIAIYFESGDCKFLYKQICDKEK
jgi:seryl-tRNA synthetase